MFLKTALHPDILREMISDRPLAMMADRLPSEPFWCLALRKEVFIKHEEKFKNVLKNMMSDEEKVIRQSFQFSTANATTSDT